MSDSKLARAEAQAADRRQRLASTAIALQSRLKPSALARNAVDQIKEVGSDAARTGADTIRRNPLPTAGVIAAFAALILRKPIMRLFRKKTN
jgi:hypothetical protein